MTQDRTARLIDVLGQRREFCARFTRSIVTKNEASQRMRMENFNAVYRLTLIYGHRHWVIIERIRSRIQAAEMRSLRRDAGLTLPDRIRSSTIRDILRAASLTLYRKITAPLVGTRTKNAA